MYSRDHKSALKMHATCFSEPSGGRTNRRKKLFTVSVHKTTEYVGIQSVGAKVWTKRDARLIWKERMFFQEIFLILFQINFPFCFTMYYLFVWLSQNLLTTPCSAGSGRKMGNWRICWGRLDAIVKQSKASISTTPLLLVHLQISWHCFVDFGLCELLVKILWC